MNKKQIDEATSKLDEQTSYDMFKPTATAASSFAIKPTLCSSCDAQLDEFIKNYNGDVNIAVEELIRQFKANATICKECTFVDSQILERFKHEIAEKKKEDEMLNKEQLAQILQKTSQQLDDEFTQDEKEKEEEEKQNEDEEKEDEEKEKNVIEELVEESIQVSLINNLNTDYDPANITGPISEVGVYLMIQMPIILEGVKNTVLLINKRIDEIGIPPADKSIYTSYVKNVALGISKSVSTFYATAEEYKLILKDLLADILSIVEIIHSISEASSQPSPSELPKGSTIPAMIKGRKTQPTDENIREIIENIVNPAYYLYTYKSVSILTLNIQFLIDLLDKLALPGNTIGILELYRRNFLIMNQTFKVERPIKEFIIDYMKLQEIYKGLTIPGKTLSFFDKGPTIGLNTNAVFDFFIGTMIPSLNTGGCEVRPIILSIKTSFPSYVFAIKTADANLYYNTRDKIFFALRNLSAFLSVAYKDTVGSVMVLELLTQASFPLSSLFPKSVYVTDKTGKYEEMCCFADIYVKDLQQSSASASASSSLISNSVNMDDIKTIFDIICGDSNTIGQNYGDLNRLINLAQQLFPNNKTYNDFLTAIYKWKIDNSPAISVAVEPATIFAEDLLSKITTAKQLEEFRYFMLYETPIRPGVTYNGLIDMFLNIVMRQNPNIKFINWGGKTATSYFWAFKQLSGKNVDCGYSKDRDLKCLVPEENVKSNQIFMMYISEYLEAMKQLLHDSNESPEIRVTLSDGTVFQITDDEKSIIRKSTRGMEEKGIDLSAVTCKYTITDTTTQLNFESVLDPLDIVSKSGIFEKLFAKIGLQFQPSLEPFLIVEGENNMKYATPLTFWLDIAVMLLEPRAKSDKDCLRLLNFGIIILQVYFGIDICDSNNNSNPMVQFLSEYFNPQFVSYCTSEPLLGIPDISESRIVQEIQHISDKIEDITYKDQLIEITRNLITSIATLPIEKVNENVNRLIQEFGRISAPCYSRTYDLKDPFSANLYSFLTEKMPLVYELYNATENSDTDFKPVIETLWSNELKLNPRLIEFMKSQFTQNCDLAKTKENIKFFIEGEGEGEGEREREKKEGQKTGGIAFQEKEEEDMTNEGGSKYQKITFIKTKTKTKTKKNKKRIKKFIKTKKNTKNANKNTRKNRKNRKNRKKSIK
jgi:hypothetical protein